MSAAAWPARPRNCAGRWPASRSLANPLVATVSPSSTTAAGASAGITSTRPTPGVVPAALPAAPGSHVEEAWDFRPLAGRGAGHPMGSRRPFSFAERTRGGPAN